MELVNEAAVKELGAIELRLNILDNLIADVDVQVERVYDAFRPILHAPTVQEAHPGEAQDSDQSALSNRLDGAHANLTSILGKLRELVIRSEL